MVECKVKTPEETANEIWDMCEGYWAGVDPFAMKKEQILEAILQAIKDEGRARIQNRWPSDEETKNLIGGYSTEVEMGARIAIGWLKAKLLVG